MKQALDKYLSHFERLQDNKIDDLLSTVSENFIFEDPFQKIKGKNQFKALLKKMLSAINIKIEKVCYKNDEIKALF